MMAYGDFFVDDFFFCLLGLSPGMSSFKSAIRRYAPLESVLESTTTGERRSVNTFRPDTCRL